MASCAPAFVPAKAPTAPAVSASLTANDGASQISAVLQCLLHTGIALEFFSQGGSRAVPAQ